MQSAKVNIEWYMWVITCDRLRSEEVVDHLLHAVNIRGLIQCLLEILYDNASGDIARVFPEFERLEAKTTTYVDECRGISSPIFALLIKRHGTSPDRFSLVVVAHVTYEMTEELGLLLDP